MQKPKRIEPQQQQQQNMNLDSSHSAMSSSSYPQNHTGDDQLDIEQQSSSKPYTLERVDSTGLPIPPPPPESPPIEKAANKMMPISINLMHNCNRNASNPQTPMVESSQKTESTTSQEIDDDILNADLKKGWSLNRKLGTFLLFVVVTIVLAISLIGIFIFGTKSEETVPVEIPLIQAPTNPTPSPALTPTKFGATPAPSPTGSAPQVTLSPTIAPTEFGITPNPTRTSFGPDPTRSPTFSPTDFGAAPVLPPTTLPSLSQTDSLERAIHKFLLQDNSDLLISPDSLAVQNAVNWLVDEANSTQSLIFPLNHQYLQRFGVLMLYFSIFLDEKVELTEVSLPADEAVPTQDECSWRGITCNGGGMVTKIELSKRQLNGTLPSEWRLFPFLKSIDFSHNNFQGSIPEEIFGILGLKEVVLNHNQFSGTLSSKIGQLWKLTQFHASHNQLSGIPSEIKMASELKSIDISSNKLRTIPEELYDILGLEKVFLYNNEISGTISSKIGKLWDLTHFHVSNNMLSGRIPPEFGSQGVKVRQIRT